MAYSTAADVKELLRELTGAVVNTDLEAAVNPKYISIESAIRTADAEIDSRLLGRYSMYLPFSPVPQLIKEISVNIAASKVLEKLNPERTDEEAGASKTYYNWANKQLELLATFKAGLTEINQTSLETPMQVAVGNVDATYVFGYGDETTWGVES